MTVSLRYHPDVAARDIPALAATCQTPEAAAAINEAIREVIEDKGVSTKEMTPPYKGWHRKKFHSSRRSLPGRAADLRLIYQWSSDAVTLQILAVGSWLSGQPEDIYSVAGEREQSL